MLELRRFLMMTGLKSEVFRPGGKHFGLLVQPVQLFFDQSLLKK
jgi:hypothetical protein